MENDVKKINGEQLKLIPKMQDYIQYMIEAIYKIPRIEKFSIGNEYKISMYQMLEETLYISKITEIQKLKHLNKIDCLLNCQRIYLRIMVKNRWIDKKKFDIAIIKIAEIGRILGGLIKYYGKNNTK